MKIVIILTVVCTAYVTSNPIDQTRQKRDIFATTGWGAGSGSYSTFYITGKQVKEEKQLRADAKKLAESALPEYIEIHTQRNDESMPQLFASTGWGPSG